MCSKDVNARLLIPRIIKSCDEIVNIGLVLDPTLSQITNYQISRYEAVFVIVRA